MHIFKNIFAAISLTIFGELYYLADIVYIFSIGMPILAITAKLAWDVQILVKI